MRTFGTPVFNFEIAAKIMPEARKKTQNAKQQQQLDAMIKRGIDPTIAANVLSWQNLRRVR